MTRVSREAFRDCFDGLVPEDRTAFVEAAYDARGWETARVDGDLWVTPPGADGSRRIAVRGADDADADDIVDAADLRQMVLYAVERETRERLFRQFFDREPSDLSGADGANSDSASASEADDTSVPTGADDASPSSTTEPGTAPPPTDRHRSDGTPRRSAAAAAGDRRADDTTRTPAEEARRERTTDRDVADGDASAERAREPTTGDDDSLPTVRWIAVGLAAVVVVGGVVAAVGPGLTSSGADDDAARGAMGSNGTASPDVMDREGLPVAPGVRRVEAAEGSLPPGVDSTGITDASALADAHEAALADRSYRFRITHREFVDGELRGVAHERAVVASPGHYRSQVRMLGAIRHESGVIAPVSTYANGTTEYVRPSGSDESHERIEIRSRARTDDLADRTGRAVRWYLSVNDSRIVGVGEATTVRIAIRGDPWPASRNVTGWALVDEDGLVRELHREYTPTSAPNVRIEVTVRIVPGPVTVTRPAWVEAATGEEANESDVREPSTPALAAPADHLSGGQA